MNTRDFSRLLLSWHESHPRLLPWKETTDPYSIWLSEIILQQTRVEQGTPYYHRFIRTFPTIHDLAAADESAVMKCWEGLGYYSRARNLHSTAKYISTSLKGIFPDEYTEILQLRGVGPYTAAAIASFAFGKSHAVVDGNVKRFISRLLGITEPTDSSGTKDQIQEFVQRCIHHADPGLFNQAIMNFGALVCKPGKPDCSSCPFNLHCKAFQLGMTDRIPYRSKKNVKKVRPMHFLHIEFQDSVLIQRRDNKDIWAKLHSLPEIDSEESKLTNEQIFNKLTDLNIQNNKNTSLISTFEGNLKQTLTHRIIHGNFYRCYAAGAIPEIKEPYYLVEKKKLSNFAFPKIIRDYLIAIGLA
jgi:A/G-specific adenine glycosylase